jgi:hypothetical protein
MAHLACPHCQKRFPVADGQAGSFVACPGCQNLVPLPGQVLGGKHLKNLWIIAYGSVVCVFLALAVVFGWRYFGTDFKTTAAQMKIREIAQACQRYWVEHDGQYPPSLEELASKDEDGKGPYLNHPDILDPWGRPFHYELDENESSGATSSTPKIYCDAPDGGFIGSRSGK